MRFTNIKFRLKSWQIRNKILYKRYYTIKYEFISKLLTSVPDQVRAEKFVANIEAKLTGSYVASANVKGFIKNVATGQEVEFVRSTSHLVSVAPADVNTLAGSAWIDHTSNMRDEERVLIRLDLNGQALQDYVKYRYVANSILLKNFENHANHR